MATATEPHRLSEALAAFALDGRFPEDIASLPPVSSTDLQPAIDTLAKSKTELQAEIHIINEETREEVSSWVKNSKLLQEDIIRSKTIANDIVRQSEAPAASGEAIQDAEEKAEFLNREVQYSSQLYGVLKGIKHVNALLDEVEQASGQQRILDSLHLLEESWAALDAVGASKTCRVMKLLDLRAFELKGRVHEAFDNVWKGLVRVDVEDATFTVHEKLPDGQMSLADAVIGLQAYKEVDERMEQFWHNLDAAIVRPRLEAHDSPRGIKVEKDTIRLDGQTTATEQAVLTDLETVLTFVSSRLPPVLLQSLCSFMMGDIIPRLIDQWLNPAVPPCLKDMGGFQDMILRAKNFCDKLDQNGYSGFEALRQWADKAPTTWLEKCRESALNAVRSKLVNGVGESKQVEKIEKQMVSISEGNELATTGAGAAAENNEWGADWGDAWDDDQPEKESKPGTNGNQEAPADEDDGVDAWGWDDNEPAEAPAKADDKPQDDEDDSAAAWGWGDDDGAGEPESKPASKAPIRPALDAKQGTRELVLKETYNISSMPEPVLELIFAILEDGALLTQGSDEYAHVAGTAPGLFGLPTFALALFRAVSPYYYSLDVGGNMFLYNDAMYLADKLSDFSATWKERDDLTTRAKAMLRLDHDIKSLRSFANRSYANEMNIQKTVLRDLIGGEQSIMQQDETEAAVESGTARIKSMAATWRPILARSVWSQAIGSLADALATKLITDVLDMPSIGQDEAYNIAKLIASATELDDLFLPSKLMSPTSPGGGEDEVPTTAQYAPNWLRLKYLSEFLQSNLNEVKFLWLESELSLYFSVDEVVDLIRASFEDNARTREAIREIQAKPQPAIQ
ncbi:Centromere/kinetochore protein [Paramyrothecium foliicola]|nr:Centromere/kinetochore protein [Paramyrothecium foliicola]